jgi:hypothetical protein
MTDRLIPSETPIGDELAVSRAKAGQPPIVPAHQRDRGVGPFKRLVLRGATVIDGTGARRRSGRPISWSRTTASRS